MADEALVTIAAAFRQLRILIEANENITQHEDYAEVQFQAKLATGIVMDYLKDRDNEQEWTADNCPMPVQASILIVLSDLWEHRAGSSTNDVFLSEAVMRLLHRYRDPALA